MCTVRWFFTVGILVCLPSGQTMAQQTASTPLLTQPSSVQQTTLTTQDYLSYAASPTPPRRLPRPDRPRPRGAEGGKEGRGGEEGG